MTVSERITELRTSKNWTVNKLANKAGISQSYLRDIELGNKNPSVEILEYICDALEFSLSSFFSFQNEKEFMEDPLVKKIYNLTPKQRKTLSDFIDSLLED